MTLASMQCRLPLAHDVEVSVKDFAQFHEFYAGELLNGRALSRTMGLDVAIVAFHPDCSLIFEAMGPPV